MNEVAWHNGKLISFAAAGLDELGWPSGSGVFETIKTVDQLPWALSRHMRRALTAARRNDSPFPPEEVIRNAVKETIAANPFELGRMRLLFGSDGSFRVTHQRYEEVTTPAKLLIFERPVSSSQLIEKRYPYQANLDLLAQAVKLGFDDGVLVNDRGEVAESAISNLLFKSGDQWVTPPLSSAVLPGIMRALIIEKMGVKVRAIPLANLAEISAGFLISSLKIAQPIARIGDLDLEISTESEQMRLAIAATALTTSVG